jgi:hypothetical protein
LELPECIKNFRYCETPPTKLRRFVLLGLPEPHQGSVSLSSCPHQQS